MKAFVLTLGLLLLPTLARAEAVVLSGHPVTAGLAQALLRDTGVRVDMVVPPSIPMNRQPSYFAGRGAGRLADAARSAQHQHTVARFDVAAILQTMDRGAIGHQQRSGLLERHAFGNREHAPGGHDQLFGKAAVAQPGHDPVTDLETLDAFAQRLDHARDLAARRKRALRLELVEIADDQRVGKIDRAGLDRNQHFALARHRNLDLVEAERFRPADRVAA